MIVTDMKRSKYVALCVSGVSEDRWASRGCNVSTRWEAQWFCTIGRAELNLVRRSPTSRVFTVLDVLTHHELKKADCVCCCACVRMTALNEYASQKSGGSGWEFHSRKPAAEPVIAAAVAAAASVLTGRQATGRPEGELKVQRSKVF